MKSEEKEKKRYHPNELRPYHDRDKWIAANLSFYFLYGILSITSMLFCVFAVWIEAFIIGGVFAIGVAYLDHIHRVPPILMKDGEEIMGSAPNRDRKFTEHFIAWYGGGLILLGLLVHLNNFFKLF